MFFLTCKTCIFQTGGGNNGNVGNRDGPDLPGCGDLRAGPHHFRHRRQEGQGRHGRQQLGGQQHIRRHHRVSVTS